MEIDKNTLHKTANLSRLNIKEEEETLLLASMNEIIDWMNRLREVDTEGVEPLTHMSFEQNVFRKDVANNSLERENGLKHAADKDGAFFRVPKVIE